MDGRKECREGLEGRKGVSERRKGGEEGEK